MKGLCDGARNRLEVRLSAIDRRDGSTFGTDLSALIPIACSIILVGINAHDCLGGQHNPRAE